MIRQGDILFIPITGEITDSTKKVESGIIAEGEATGHHHRIAEEDMQFGDLLEVGWRGDRVLRVSQDGLRIVHEEHGTSVLPAGTYKIHQAREFDYLAGLSRPVRD